MTWIIEIYLNSKIVHKNYKKNNLNSSKMTIVMNNELLWKKKWHSLNTNNQNKPKMAWFFKIQVALKLNFIEGQFFNKYQNLDVSKSGKSNIEIVKFRVQNFQHFDWKVWNWKCWAFALKY